MLLNVPAALGAADNPVAILKTSGTGVTVNDRPAVNSSALYITDLIRTEKGAAARIEGAGSTVDISPETIVQFGGDELVLDHGSLSVNTTVGLKVRVGCLTVTPVNGNDWTHYDVSDVNGRMTVSALKSDAYIKARSKNPKEAKEPGRSERSIVREGEQKSREDKCGAGYANSSAATAAHGAILNSPWTKLAGAAGVGVLACLGLCHDDDPISPHTP